MLCREYSGKSIPFRANGEDKEVVYLTRVDPLTGSVAKISEDRARRQIGITVNLSVQATPTCDFCSYATKTPERRIEHRCGCVSVPNLYPWEKYDWVTIYPPYSEHKKLLSELFFDDLERMIESSFDLALECSKDADVLAFMDFTNWGAFAGASQQHPHSQRKSVTWVLPPRQEQELHQCRKLWLQHRRNPFDLLAQEERAAGLRVIHDNDVFISAAFAPTCANEIIVFPNESFTHILQMSAADREKIICPTLGIFPALFFYRGVSDLNIAIHMAPFRGIEEAEDYYRWHMHIYPRRSRLPAHQAGAEIGFETQVIDVLPEATAEALRSWYIEGPKYERLAKGPDGQPNPLLVEEFERFLNTHGLKIGSACGV